LVKPFQFTEKIKAHALPWYVDLIVLVLQSRCYTKQQVAGVGAGTSKEKKCQPSILLEYKNEDAISRRLKERLLPLDEQIELRNRNL
tara:strand:- start:471 stop:731 length:261 start_codon:yes stop_codon:yes gene_type:complete